MTRNQLAFGLFALGTILPLALPAAAAPALQKMNRMALSYYSLSDIPPAIRAKDAQATKDYNDGAAEMRAKNYVSAQNSFEASLTNAQNGNVYLGIGEALTAQGKTKEALQAYWNLFHPGPRQSWGGTYFSQAEMEYAVLLSENGRWPEAVGRYKEALSDVNYRSSPEINAYFDPAKPEPKRLQAAADIGTGLEVTHGGVGFDASAGERAFEEYTKALKLTPDWPVANYYYGFGWQNLTPPERSARAGQREAVKAALEKAAKLGTPDVAAAAKTELQTLR